MVLILQGLGFLDAYHIENLLVKINNIGLNAKEILSNKLKGYILFGVEPDLDSFMDIMLLIL